MAEKRTTERARRKLRAGKSPSTAAGEFVREEIEHVREGKPGARSAKQAIAIGLFTPVAPQRAPARPRRSQQGRPARRPHPAEGLTVRKRRHKRYPGAAGKGSHPRISARPRRTTRQGRLGERGRTTSEAVAKRRLRSLKRETGGGRGKRTRQRRT